jgi:hypothetical protein
MIRREARLNQRRSRKTSMRVLIVMFSAILATALAVPARAQSPNTATIVVVVSDETGGVLKDAKVSIANTDTGASREVMSGPDGSVTLPALAISGSYTVKVTKSGFTTSEIKDVTLRAGELATVKVKLVVAGGKSAVTVYGTTEGVRSDPELGRRLDNAQIDETPVLGRKVTSLPLLNAAFRSAKGTGDLFVNATYFVTGAGGRRQPTYAIDGATGDEPWGRQTMLSTVPVGAVQEMNVVSRAFSSEFGWTSSAAINIVTKSGTNVMHGDGLFLGRPGGLQPTTLGTSNQCPPSLSTCVAPTLNGNAVPITAPDIPDSLSQGSFALGGPLAKNQTYYFIAGDYTHQDRTAPITSPLVPTGTTIVGNYRQALVDGRIDQTLSPSSSLMARVNLDRFFDNNPQDAVSGNVLPSAGREFIRHTYSAQVNETSVLSSTMLNEARFEYQNADPVTDFQPLTPSTQFTRAGSVPFTSGESRAVNVFSRQSQFSDTLSWTRDKHYLRAGGSAAYASSGGNGTEFGSAFTLGQFTVNASTTKTPDQLTLADVTRYQQSFNFGAGTYVQNQWIFAGFLQDSYRVRTDLTVDLGLRYDRQTFSDGTRNFAPRVGFGWSPGGDPKTAVRGGYGIYYTLLRSNLDASFVLGGPQGIFTYTATPGQNGFPTSLTGAPVVFDPNAALSTLPARNITIRPGMRSFYEGLIPGFDKLPNYPSQLVNPKSQVGSIGLEREIIPRLFLSVDYVRQHWTGLDETADLNAPSLFVRTAPGQVRTAAAADLTRPIVPVNGGFRQINVIENLGIADYNGLQTMVSYRGSGKVYASVSYTLSKATNTTEPDGNGAGPNDFNQLGPQFETAPSLLDQRHRVVINFTYQLPYNITVGTVAQLASAKPFNPTTGLDNNGDGSNSDRPVINGQVAGRYSFRGTATSDVALFAEGRLTLAGRTVLLRVEGFNVFNHANILGRNGTYGDLATGPLATFGTASAGLSNVDPARMFQFQVRFTF